MLHQRTSRKLALCLSVSVVLVISGTIYSKALAAPSNNTPITISLEDASAENPWTPTPTPSGGLSGGGPCPPNCAYGPLPEIPQGGNVDQGWNLIITANLTNNPQNIYPYRVACSVDGAPISYNGEERNWDPLLGDSYSWTDHSWLCGQVVRDPSDLTYPSLVAGWIPITLPRGLAEIPQSVTGLHHFYTTLLRDLNSFPAQKLSNTLEFSWHVPIIR